MDDRNIIELFYERNEQAIRETQNKYGRLCFKVAYNILGNNEDSEECANDTYFTLWQKIPPERPDNFAAYISRIAKLKAMKKFEYNSAEKRSANSVVSWSELEETIPDNSFDDKIEDRKVGELINAFLREEKEEKRNVFIRRYYFNDSISDIAENFNFSESKVKSILFHTRNKLKKYLKENGVCI